MKAIEMENFKLDKDTQTEVQFNNEAGNFMNVESTTGCFKVVLLFTAILIIIAFVLFIIVTMP